MVTVLRQELLKEKSGKQPVIGKLISQMPWPSTQSLAIKDIWHARCLLLALETKVSNVYQAWISENLLLPLMKLSPVFVHASTMNDLKNFTFIDRKSMSFNSAQTGEALKNDHEERYFFFKCAIRFLIQLSLLSRKRLVWRLALVSHHLTQ